MGRTTKDNNTTHPLVRLVCAAPHREGTGDHSPRGVKMIQWLLPARQATVALPSLFLFQTSITTCTTTTASAPHSLAAAVL